MGGEWDLIITFENKLYFGESVIGSHNKNSVIKIDTVPLNPNALIFTQDLPQGYDISGLIPYNPNIGIKDQGNATISTKIKNYFETRKAHLKHVLNSYLKIYPVVVSTSQVLLADDRDAEFYHCVYALCIEDTAGQIMSLYCDVKFLEDIDPRMNYPSKMEYNASKDSFKDLRVKAGHLDIITIGELYALAKFFHMEGMEGMEGTDCLLYTSPSPRDS